MYKVFIQNRISKKNSALNSKQYIVIFAIDIPKKNKKYILKTIIQKYNTKILIKLI